MASKTETDDTDETEAQGLEEWRAAQIQRMKDCKEGNHSEKGFNSWAQSIIEANIELAETVQREQCVKEEIDQLMASPGSREKKQIRKLHE
jgi:hypothetical protein